MANTVFIYEIVILPFIIIFALLFSYNYYKSSPPKSKICVFIKIVGISIILILVNYLTQTAATVLF